MARKLSSDSVLLALTLGLLGFGLISVWSASTALSQEEHGNGYHFLIRQALWATLGLAVMVAAWRVDYRVLRNPYVVYGVAGVTTALLILALVMPMVNETHRWLRLGPLSFQPAEMAKVASILFLAFHLERKGLAVNDTLSSLFPIGLLLGWFCFLIYIQPDLGSAATVALIGCVMMFLAGVQMRYFVAIGAVGMVLLYLAITGASYRLARIIAFLNPSADPRGAAYQITQSLIAVGTGGNFGLGLMDSRQKLFYLPYPYSDFIYAVIAEELGLLGAAAVVLAFLAFLWRGLRAAWRAPDPFGTYLAAGFTLAVVLQAFTNMSVVLGLMPTKGIPLPFISAGGTSLLFTLLGVGVVLSVSQHADAD